MVDRKMGDDAPGSSARSWTLAQILAEKDPGLPEAYGLEGRTASEANRELAAASPRRARISPCARSRSARSRGG